ncbi:dihydrodipicolinate synthase family protein [Oricola indica]|uniref:dihydrodipicolinate synthase family protein n=1 Tax=Oricola indica TaxID=2872591 RepID=UPI001CBF4045|nr:dihydrodipicolinate synthase family protein [Oricola indica]
MPVRLNLPTHGGELESYTLHGDAFVEAQSPPQFNRIAYAAAHVVADPLLTLDPWLESHIDWDATLAFRRHLWKYGFRIAEAMDTSQRGMGLGWETARELIRRSTVEARSITGADLASGVGTDQLEITQATSRDDVIAAYEEQLGFVEGVGGRGVLMASRALAAVARDADDFSYVYDRILSQASNKVVLHWLGDAFDPALKGYWGSERFEHALDTVLAIIETHKDKVEGIKLSLLDSDKEIALRRRLPEGILMFTGDDFNYPELIEGDSNRHSHALLGIFDAIAPVACSALVELAKGENEKYRALMTPTVPLARKIFEAPTQYYKAGIVFLAWLNGHQGHFQMVGGMQSSRSILHYADIFRLADRAGLLVDPDYARSRMLLMLSMAGVEAA